MGRWAGQGFQLGAGAGEDGDRNRAENLLPLLPIWELGEGVATHQPDETSARERTAQGLLAWRRSVPLIPPTPSRPGAVSSRALVLPGCELRATPPTA